MRKTFILIPLLCLGSCELIDLPRDNPNDIHFSGDDHQLEGNLEFDQYSVCLKKSGVSSHISASYISPNSEAWLELKVKNVGSGRVSGVTGVVSSQNSWVVVQPNPNGLPLRFVSNFGTSTTAMSDFIEKGGNVGTGVLNSGNYFWESSSHQASSCGFLYYSAKVNVQNGAQVGTNAAFTILLTDDKSNSWSVNFSIPIQP